MPRKDIKEILLEKELITDEAVEKAEEIEKISGEPLGEILVRMGFLTDIDFVQTLAEYHDVPFVNLQEVTITPEILRLVPQTLAMRHKILPVFRRGDTLMGARPVKAYLNRPEFEIYDLETDPNEVNNLASDPARRDVFEELHGKVLNMMKATKDPWYEKYVVERP